MGVKLILFILIITFAIFAASYAHIGEEAKPSKAAIYILEDSVSGNMKTFVSEGSQAGTVTVEPEVSKVKINARRFNMEQEDENAEFAMKSKLKRVVRSVDDGTIIGYSKELDNPGFERVD